MTAKNEELKNCPFCGNKITMFVRFLEINSEQVFQCEKCNVEMRGNHYESIRKKWNTRFSAPQNVDASSDVPQEKKTVALSERSDLIDGLRKIKNCSDECSRISICLGCLADYLIENFYSIIPNVEWPSKEMMDKIEMEYCGDSCIEPAMYKVLETCKQAFIEAVGEKPNKENEK